MKKQIKMTVRAIACALCAVLCLSAFAGCAQKNEGGKTESLKDTPITVNAMVVELAARAGYSTAALPEQFYLKIDQDGTTYDRNALMKYESSKWVAYDAEYGDPITLLWEGSDGITVTAATFPLSTTSVNINVETSQNVENKLNLSDHLFYTSSTVNPSTAGINIAFEHIMTKINLTITLGDEFGATTNPISDVTFGGTKTAVTYDYSDEGSSRWSFANDAAATGITALEGAYTAPPPEAPNATANYEVILIPQAVAKGTFTVTFEVGERVFSWTYTDAVTFESGYEYTLNLTAGKDKVTSSTFTTTAWNTGTGDSNNLIGATE